MGVIMRDGIPYCGNSGLSSDTNVTQIQSSDNADYEVLLGGSADELTHTESAKKSNKLKVNPSTGDVSMTGDIKLTGTGNTWDGKNTSIKQAIADLRSPGLANGILYSFSAIGNALQLGQITGTIFGYIDIVSRVTSSTVGDSHEVYLFSLNVDEFISATGTTPGTEYPVESAQLIHTGQESGLAFVAYYDQSNNIYLRLRNMLGYAQTLKHASLYLSNPTVITV